MLFYSPMDIDDWGTKESPNLHYWILIEVVVEQRL